ncbi:MAG: DUF192 domain-containing protein [Eubacterium sp.]|nr:DUF192 domain-containing protein [Eubacterium sp.]
MKCKELVINQEKVGKVYIADNFFLRLRGLIGRDPSEIGALLIKPCSQIHTFMMSAPIDVVYIDSTGKVLKIDENVEKNKCKAIVKKSKAVVEFPAFRAKELNICPGDVITVSED